MTEVYVCVVTDGANFDSVMTKHVFARKSDAETYGENFCIGAKDEAELILPHYTVETITLD